MKLMYFFSLVLIGYLLNNVLLFNNRIKQRGERIYQVHVYLMHTSKQHLYITGIVCFEPLGTRWRDMAAIISSTDLTQSRICQTIGETLNHLQRMMFPLINIVRIRYCEKELQILINDTRLFVSDMYLLCCSVQST